MATANAAGASTGTYSYGPFGEPDSMTGLRFRYTGQQLIGELGLYYYKARFYSPMLGRFLQTDPIGYADDVNLYAYVGNNPINRTDPSGLMAKASSGGYFSSSSSQSDAVAPSAADGSYQVAIGPYQKPTEVMLFDAGGGGSGGGGSVGSGGGGGIFGGGGAAKGGRLGNEATRAQVNQVATEMETRGWKITGGGGRGPEEYLPGPGGARSGSSYPDITATKNGKTLRVNTVDTRADGVTLTTREATNADRIRAQTGEHVLTIPKP